MTQIINDKLKKCCEQCNKYMDTPCAWLSLGNEYCTEIMEVQQEIERLNNIINELERYINEEYIYDELGMKIFDASKLQEKLQELKDSDKE